MLLSSKLLKRAPVSGIRLYRVDAAPIVAAGKSTLPEEDLAGSVSRGEVVVMEKAAGCSPDGTEDTGREGTPGESRRELEQLREKMMQEVDEERQQAVKEGYEKGYASGFDEGKKQAEAEYYKLIKEAGERLEQARRSAREIVASSEKTVVELAVAVAETLLHSQLELAPEKIVEIVKEAINSLPEGDMVKVYLNPKDLPPCLRYQEEMEGNLKQFQQVELIPQQEMPRGSCRVESESSTVEFLLDEEKERLQETLLEVARKEMSKNLREGSSFYGKH